VPIVVTPRPCCSQAQLRVLDGPQPRLCAAWHGLPWVDGGARALALAAGAVGWTFEVVGASALNYSFHGRGGVAFIFCCPIPFCFSQRIYVNESRLSVAMTAPPTAPSTSRRRCAGCRSVFAPSVRSVYTSQHMTGRSVVSCGLPATPFPRVAGAPPPPPPPAPHTHHHHHLHAHTI
jgi:hypothetical protein